MSSGLAQQAIGWHGLQLAAASASGRRRWREASACQGDQGNSWNPTKDQLATDLHDFEISFHFGHRLRVEGHLSGEAWARYPALPLLCLEVRFGG